MVDDDGHSMSISVTALETRGRLEKSLVLDVLVQRESVASLLLDCGWCAPYGTKEGFLERYRGVLDGARNVCGVLISHPDLEHMGGIVSGVIAKEQCGGVYITGAGHKMGQMVAYDAYLNAHSSNTEATPFDLDNVDDAFKDMVQMRYRQEVMVHDGRGVQIRVTPYPSGRLVGGAIWKIHIGGPHACHDVVYAVDYNHKREMHLMPGALMDYGSMLTVSSIRPALVITEACSLDMVPVPIQYARNERLLVDICMSCLRAEGNVLIPVDAAGRLLEILLLLNTHWKEKNLTYPLAALGPMMHTTLDFARSQLEWMNEDLVKSLGHSRVENPLALKYVTPCTSIKDVKKLSRGPKVIVATSDSLEDGHSRTLFTWWANQPNSAIVLALEPTAGSLASKILDMDQSRNQTGRPAPSITIGLSKRVPLKGEELEAWHASSQNKKEQIVDEKVEEDTEKGTEKVEKEAIKGTKSKDPVEEQAMNDVEHVLATPVQGKTHVQQMSAAKRANVAVIEHASRDGVEIDPFRMDNAADMDLDKEDNDACLIEGFEVGIDVADPMFPDEDAVEKIQYDEYGAIIDLEELDRDVVGGTLGRALASEAAAERYAAEGGEEIEDVVEPEVPTKIETTETTVQVAARVVRLNFDGRSDGPSVQTMLAQIAPRSCIIVQGSDQARSKLASSLTNYLEGLNPQVFAPDPHEPVEIPLGPARAAIMSDELFQSIHMHPMQDIELGWLDADLQVASADDGTGDVLLNQKLDSTGGPSRGGVFIGDVKLSQLKRALARANIAADFHAGGLYCDGDILVRRQGDDGGLVLEGSLSDQYFKIRDIVYSQYHIC